MPERVLIVEDEADLARLLAFNLSQAGYETEVAGTAAEALLAAGRTRPDVVVLDLMLPDLPGFDVCRQVRRDPALSHCGVLILTARGEEEDRIAGLEAGADDYVVKPFNVREVVLRVGALLRRMGERRAASGAAGGASSASASALVAGDLEVDPLTHDVRVCGEPIQLRPLEFKLLVTLLAHPGRVFTRKQLLAEVWDLDEHAGNPRTVDVHVRRLRQNLGPCAAIVETVPGFGYRIRG